MAVLSLAWKSLLNRRFTVLLTLFSIALSCALLLGVERIRSETRQAFSQSVSGTDLVVGARGGGVNLLLYSVFHIGNASNNLSWESYRRIAADPRVAWAIPLSMGDSHKGYRVVGTDGGFFAHFRYGDRQPLKLAQGRPFTSPGELVLGAEVARRLNYSLDARVVVAHGAGEVSFVHHDDHPFRVVGILAPTGTPVDRALYVDLEGMEAIHRHWGGGATPPALGKLPKGLAAMMARGMAPRPGAARAQEQAHQDEHEHEHEHAGHAGADAEGRQITAFLLGLKARPLLFALQREINEDRAEPLSAVIPGVALQELWSMLAVVERALLAMSALVVLVGLVGMLSLMLSGLNERRREMAILRALGARPRQILLLILGETLFLTLLGIGLGLFLLYLALWLAQPLIQARLGLFLPLASPSPLEWGLMAGIVAAGLLAGLVPAYRAYRYALSDGMSIRV